MDAAVAANAVMGVVAPMMNGIGGDLFVIVYDAKSRKALRLERQRLGALGIDAGISEIAGHYGNAGAREFNPSRCPAWWTAGATLLERFGRKKFADDLAPAIHYAADGFPVSERTAVDWEAGAAAISELTRTP